MGENYDVYVLAICCKWNFRVQLSNRKMYVQSQRADSAMSASDEGQQVSSPLVCCSASHSISSQKSASRCENGSVDVERSRGKKQCGCACAWRDFKSGGAATRASHAKGVAAVAPMPEDK